MTTEEKNEYIRRMNLVINRDKSDYLESLLGWQAILDSFELLFDSQTLKVKFHLKEGERTSRDSVISCKANAIKCVFELFNEHYFYIVPKGFVILFDGAGVHALIKEKGELTKIIGRYEDMYFNPSNY